MTSEKITEILSAKESAGSSAYLWLHDSGDCILWPTEEASERDNGSKAIGRWKLTKAEVAELIGTGECDDVA
jgi:hypothetical protein